METLLYWWLIGAVLAWLGAMWTFPGGGLQWALVAVPSSLLWPVFAFLGHTMLWPYYNRRERELNDVLAAHAQEIEKLAKLASELSQALDELRGEHADLENRLGSWCYE